MLSAKKIYHILLFMYGKPQWWSEDPFIVMFQSVLVQNTTWSSVEKACTLIGDKLTLEYMEHLPTEELERLISPCGFYKVKARTIQSLITWYGRYHFDYQNVQNIRMEDLRKELLAIRGIGAETADVILVYAFYQPSFIIDAYTRRFLLRLGYVFLDDVAIKKFFETDLPRDAQLYGWYHWLILEHSISVCKKIPSITRFK
ncbi:MAG: endonuclease [Enterocloster clostridioformis]|uniref:endonuclease III domain-containing protein n=1 Tax=Enterocloster clostridioformis TaxID=1531 RepID=UPI0029053A00|nr:endonuclease [Enterocloster clostridioformis]MDU1962886.1 endonuclease [Enterocloster clostridioformis]